jgi:hypothetical protein
MNLSSLTPLLLFIGCNLEPQHTSCPEGTKAETFFEFGSTKTFACTKSNVTGKRSYGWELSFHSAGEPFTSMRKTDPKKLYLTCRTKQGGAALEAIEIQRMSASTAYDASCLGKPLRPIFNQFERKLTAYYEKKASDE